MAFLPAPPAAAFPLSGKLHDLERLGNRSNCC
jgi:hypothetical protein